MGRWWGSPRLVYLMVCGGVRYTGPFYSNKRTKGPRAGVPESVRRPSISTNDMGELFAVLRSIYSQYIWYTEHRDGSIGTPSRRT